MAQKKIKIVNTAKPKEVKQPNAKTQQKVAGVVAENKQPKAKQKMDVKDRSQKKNHIDWSPIKTKYITDPKVSLKKLATEFDISERSVSLRSKKEGWVKLRQDYVKKTESNVLAESSAERQEKIRELKETHNKMFNGIKTKLIKATEALDVDEWAAKNLEHLSKAAKHIMEAERLTIGLPSDVKGLSDPEGEKFTVTMEQLHAEAEEALSARDQD